MPSSPASTAIFSPTEARRIWYEAELRRARAAAKRRLYEHRWMEMLELLIQSRYAAQNQSRVLPFADTSWPLYRWVVDRLGGIYSAPPARRFGELEWTAPVAVDLALDSAARAGYSAGVAAVRPIVSHGEIALRVSPADLFSAELDPISGECRAIVIAHVLPRRSIADEPTGFSSTRHVSLDDSERVAWYEVWTPAEAYACGPGWDRRALAGIPDGTNPYGFVPWILTPSHLISGAIDDTETDGLATLTLEVGVARTDLSRLRHLQSHRQIVFTVGSGGKLDSESGAKYSYDPATPLILRQGTTASVLETASDISKLQETIATMVDVGLRPYGFQQSVVRGTDSASSGYALLLQSREMSRILARHRTMWGVHEAAIWDAARSISKLDGGPPIPEGTLTLEWPSPYPEIDEAMRHEAASAVATLVSSGVISAAEGRRRLGYTDAESADIGREIAREGAAKMPSLWGRT